MDRNQQIYRLWLRGVSQSEIARRFGITPGRVRQILARIQGRELKGLDVDEREFTQKVRRAAWRAQVPARVAYRLVRELLREYRGDGAV